MLEPHQADPVSLVRFPSVLLTRGAVAKLEEMLRMSGIQRHRAADEACMLAPVVSEKSTLVADRHRQYVFRVAEDATKPEIKAAVELMFKTQVETVQVART
ncbi:MAG: hypothetical protein KatS3mg123_1413 [Burkholderiales bacterium]|nr:MAG: hypothetical protein KatS3mg123_1413 [Burkholderiales bacterium]